VLPQRKGEHHAPHRSWLERYQEANRHVASGREVIRRQRDLIDRKKAHGRTTDDAEDLLAVFERTQTIFEDDLTRITRERGEVSY
jgi:uncharacterized protein YciI